MRAATVAGAARTRSAWAGRIIPLALFVLSAIGFILFVAAQVLGQTEPGSSAGMGFGIAAAAALLLVMVYSMRRAMPAVRSLGPTRHYLQIHIYGGVLFLVLVLLHTGFRLPAGVLLTTLWLLALWVVASGLIGLAIQRTVPRLLDAASSFEVNAQRIPELVADLRSRAQALALTAGSTVHAYYTRELAADMAEPRAALGSLLGRTRVASYRAQEFEILRRTLPADTAPQLDDLFRLHETKLEMDVHFTLQRVLRLWLYFHLPASIVLLGLVVMHVILVLYY